MNEQAKRGPGRPRKAERRVHIDITLSLETIEYLNMQQVSRSQFIERLIQAHRENDRSDVQFWNGIEAQGKHIIR